MKYTMLVLCFWILFDCAAQQTTSRLYLAINLNSCDQCNKASAKVFERQGLKALHVTLLFDSVTATAEQIQEFVTTTFGKNIPYLINDTLFRKASNQIQFFKYPHLVIVDTALRVVTQFPINEVRSAQDLLRTYEKYQWQQRTYSNKQLRKNYSFRHLNNVGEYLFISDWGSSTKIYYLNTRTNKLDSIYLASSDSLINLLIARKGFEGVDAKKVKMFFKQYDFPYEIASYATHPRPMGNLYNNVLYIEFVEEKKLSDTVRPELLRYLFSFDPSTKKYTFYDYKSYTMDEYSEELENDLRLEYGHLERIHDTLWMIGTEHINQFHSATKTFVYLSKSSTDSFLFYKGQKLVIPTDSFYDFDGQRMGNPLRLEFFKLIPSFLVYMSSPYFYRRSDNAIFNIRNFVPGSTWIHDVQETDNILTFITEENSMLYISHIHKPTMRLLKREYVCNVSNIKSNVLLDESLNVYFIEKSGVVSIFKRKPLLPKE